MTNSEVNVWTQNGSHVWRSGAGEERREPGVGKDSGSSPAASGVSPAASSAPAAEDFKAEYAKSDRRRSCFFTCSMQGCVRAVTFGM